MKIKTQVSISIIVFVILAALIISSYFSSEFQLHEIQKKQAIIDNIEKSSFELYYLENDYIVHGGGTRTVEHWNAKYVLLTGQLKELTLTNPSQAAVLNSMLESHADLQPTFSDLVAVTGSAQGNESILASQRVKEFAASTLTEHSQMMMSRSSELSQLVKAETLEVEKRRSQIISSSILVLMIFVLLNYLLINRSVLRSISALGKEAERIGSGDLDTKIETVSNDELGDLSLTITAMASNLKTVLTSKSELEKEVAERRQAEEAVRVSRDLLTKSEADLQTHQVELETQAEELRRAHLELGESRDKYVDLYDFAPIGYLTLTNKALVTEANLACATLLGIERSKMKNARFRKFIAQKDSELWDQYFMALLKQEDKQTCTLMLNRSDASMFPARLESIRITSRDATPTVRVAVSDITDIREVEETLRKSEEKIRLLLNSAAEAIHGIDMNGNCTFCNNSCLQLLGYKHQDELLGRNMHWLIHGKHTDGTHFPVEECRIFRAFQKGEGSHVDDEVLWRADGTSFPAEYWSYPQRHDGKVVGAVVTFLDITERKRAEEALRQANKKLTLLSSITRHDINNQLTVQMGYLSFLELKQFDSTQNEYFRKVSTAAKRISAMIQFTKEYEEIGVHAPTWQDIRTLVDTAVKQAPLGTVMVKNDCPAGTEVFADPLIEKVFYNLMDNAERYGGKITTLRFSFEESEDIHLVICEDDGEGVPVEEKEKIFERGFGKNTGLGLALSREILSITGITIRETGEPGKGARFEMAVPKGMWRSAGRGT